MEQDKKNIPNNEEGMEILEQVSGGSSSYSGGYCPYTPDRNCRVERQGNWEDGEFCKLCGWRAW